MKSANRMVAANFCRNYFDFFVSFSRLHRPFDTVGAVRFQSSQSTPRVISLTPYLSLIFQLRSPFASSSQSYFVALNLFLLPLVANGRHGLPRPLPVRPPAEGTFLPSPSVASIAHSRFASRQMVEGGASVRSAIVGGGRGGGDPVRSGTGRVFLGRHRWIRSRLRTSASRRRRVEPGCCGGRGGFRPLPRFDPGRHVVVGHPMVRLQGSV
ncbi:hypothetical protein BHE74_00011192 [Ensete ventricosum]|nr:hypothetical protein BHE74_00011192 [Ensete ventricosum]